MTQNIQTTEHCPICKMPVDCREANPEIQRDGRIYFFCSQGCKDQFLAEGCRAHSQGRWGRFLERLAKANER